MFSTVQCLWVAAGLRLSRAGALRERINGRTHLIERVTYCTNFMNRNRANMQRDTRLWTSATRYACATMISDEAKTLAKNPREKELEGTRRHRREVTFRRAEQHEVLSFHSQLLLVDSVLDSQNASQILAADGDSAN